MVACPVCSKKCKESTTECKTCGFSDGLGIARVIITLEEAQHWLETIVKPHRREWQSRTRHKEIAKKIENLEKEFLSRLEKQDELIAKLEKQLAD